MGSQATVAWNAASSAPVASASFLDWNAPAIGFYRGLGAGPMDEWTTFRLTGEALEALAAAGPPRPQSP